MSVKFRMMKVFECHDMPPDLRMRYLELQREWGRGHNDTFVSWEVGVEGRPDADDPEDPEDVVKDIDAWLVAGGAEDLETVIVSCCW